MTDWKKIGIEIGSITSPYRESGGNNYAKLALEHILGEEWIKETVNTALSGELGSELAMNCLRHLSSEKAVDYAYSIYKLDPNIERKRMAVWLIKHLAIEKSYLWVEEFLNDQNVIDWGIGVLDQLLWCNIIDYEDEKPKIDYLLKLADTNSNGLLRENIDFIKEYLKGRLNVE